MFRVSIIIPTLNEAHNLPKLLHRLRQSGDRRLADIIVADGGSIDDTLRVACKHGATHAFSATQKGRAAQMNEGAKRASGDILYFVHADTLPPSSYLDDIQHAIEEGYGLGCYRFEFDSDKWFLKINAYCTRFDCLMFRGGDQTLFVKKSLFDKLEGYKAEYRIMEEYDFLIRARKLSPFCIMPKAVQVSARKYLHNSYMRVNISNLIIFSMFRIGCSQDKMARLYKWLLTYRIKLGE